MQRVGKTSRLIDSLMSFELTYDVNELLSKFHEIDQ